MFILSLMVILSTLFIKLWAMYKKKRKRSFLFLFLPLNGTYFLLLAFASFLGASLVITSLPA